VFAFIRIVAPVVKLVSNTWITLIEQ